ncbi:MAG: 4Fe-4S dicluster domain-containing protein [Desulfobacterales bacterium]|nr:MAG: 4Fe-4S dicluster domain-containing protein [Desulfobacterales bacterium]
MNRSASPANAEQLSRESRTLAPVQAMIRSCIQCGTCTGSCPNAFAMDRTPRQLWRLVLMGRQKAIFESKTFALCSACYYCTLRCPRGLPLTEAMGALKQIAARENRVRHRPSTLFHENFIRSVRRHGRVKEMELMTRYWAAVKNPVLPLRFALLGMKLMAKGKVSLDWPSKAKRPLETLFRKVEELEGRS